MVIIQQLSLVQMVYLLSCLSVGENLLLRMSVCLFLSSLVYLSQVIDVSETSPEEALKICHLVPDVRFSVLVCGGDGTVGWVLRAIEQADMKVRERKHQATSQIACVFGCNGVCYTSG